MNQDPNPNRDTYTEYTGSVGFEKKFHQTHFQGVAEQPTHPKDDPNWEYIGMGRYRRKHVQDSYQS